MTDTINIDDEYLMPTSAARKRLGSIGETTFWKIVRDGRLPVVKIGRRTFVRASALTAFMEGLRGRGPPA